ncbi:MAG: lipid II:glycine glycyltransferase FemX [Bacteroidota bacterium]
MSLTVLTLDERDNWNTVLAAMPQMDIYYTPDYAEIQQEIGEGSPRLAVWEHPDWGGPVVYAFLVRDIPGCPGLFDITTPYGYGGPVYAGDRQSAASAMGAFRREFNDYCRDSHVVSEFIRFHPLLENWVGDCEGVATSYVRDTVVIELNPDCDPLTTLPPKTRNMVRKAQNAGITVTGSADDQSLAEFFRLYNATMERNEAMKYYYFPPSFFSDLVRRLIPPAYLLTAWLNDRVIASSLFMGHGPFLHYHFSGSDREYQGLGTNNLVLYEAAKLGQSIGARRFHLGGGYSAPEDSLFRFKASFSNVRAQFYVGRKIHNQAVYDQLCNLRGPSKSGRFPAYRD